MSEAEIDKAFQDTKQKHPGLYHRHVSEREAKWFIETQSYLAMNRKTVEELWFLSRWFYEYIQNNKTYCSECRDRIKATYND